MADLKNRILANRYRVDEFIGKGGMAEVYKVWDQRRAVFLAMKVLHADLSEDKVFLRRFEREAQTLADLQHPHIVRFYGLEHDDGLTFMLMEYVNGRTLRKEIFDASGPLSPERSLEILRQICSALYYAHGMGRVHCDIKPTNIMMKSNGDTLLADFGIARMVESSTTTTLSGAGTPAYMAPEQILGKKPLPQTDLYALGIVLYEMLTGGERPFTGEHAPIDGTTAEKVRWEHLQAKPPSPRMHNPSITPELEAVVFKCLEKEPFLRYDSAMDLLQALERVMAMDVVTIDGSETSAEKPQPTPILPLGRQPTVRGKNQDLPKKSSSKVLLAALGVGTFFLAILFMVFLGGKWLPIPPQSTSTMIVINTNTILPPPTTTNTSIPLSETPHPSLTPTLAFTPNKSQTPTLIPTLTRTTPPTPIVAFCNWIEKKSDSWQNIFSCVCTNGTCSCQKTAYVQNIRNPSNTISMSLTNAESLSKKNRGSCKTK
jgi:serine/threonine protein kinase